AANAPRSRDVALLATQEPRHVLWCVAPNRQEERQREIGFVPTSRRGRPLLRVDRRPKEERRRELLVATLHAEVREEQLVKDQSRKGDPAHRARANECGRDPRGRASQT